jgi:penicillin-binding protein 2
VYSAFLIVSRLCYLQIKQWHYFKEKSTKNFLRTERIPSLRGNIVDKNGVILATNRPVVLLYWHGTGNTEFSAEQESIAQMLCSLTGRSYEKEFLQFIRAEKQRNDFLLVRDLPFEVLCHIAEVWGVHANIKFETHFQRYYPHNVHACHVVGYLGNINSQPEGIMGLEKFAHHALQGKDGTLLKTVNSRGRSLQATTIEPGHTGETVHSTLDSNLQAIAERVFPGEYCGTILVMDPTNGALRVVLSRPGFDPSLFLGPISSTHWQLLQNNQPFLNRAFQACYPIGSIFKLVTVSAALEHKLIRPDSTWYCGGFYEYKNRRYWCNCRYGHGKLTTLEAVAHSCNILFFDIGSRIDVDLIASYAHKFGLGSKTGALFPEKQGIVPSRAWKYEHRGEPWWQGETLSVSIGQSFLLATPLQVIRMIAGIFTGYLVRPRLTETELIDMQPLTILSETRQFLKDSMLSVVNFGTGRRMRTIKNMVIHAKTSTAQVSDLSKRTHNNKHLEHGWFVAHVSYKNEPPLMIVVVVENAGSAKVPTDVAKQFLIQYKKFIDTDCLRTFCATAAVA